MVTIDGIEYMGRNEYARHRKDSPSAVTKAESSKRIAAAVKRNEQGGFVGIHWRLADELWALNTDGDQAARNGKGVGPSVAQSAQHGEPGGVQLPLEEPGAAGAGHKAANVAAASARDPHGLQAARGITAKFEAKQAELDYLEGIGALVSTEELKTVGMQRYRALRDRLRAIPDRVSAELAAEPGQAQVHARLSAEIDRVLYELSDEARTAAARGVDERVAA